MMSRAFVKIATAQQSRLPLKLAVPAEKLSNGSKIVLTRNKKSTYATISQEGL